LAFWVFIVGVFVRRKAAIMLIRRTAIGAVLPALVVLPTAAQDYEKGASAYLSFPLSLAPWAQWQ